MGNGPEIAVVFESRGIKSLASTICNVNTKGADIEDMIFYGSFERDLIDLFNMPNGHRGCRIGIWTPLETTGGLRRNADVKAAFLYELFFRGKSSGF